MAERPSSGPPERSRRGSLVAPTAATRQQPSTHQKVSPKADAMAGSRAVEPCVQDDREGSGPHGAAEGAQQVQRTGRAREVNGFDPAVDDVHHRRADHGDTDAAYQEGHGDHRVRRCLSELGKRCRPDQDERDAGKDQGPGSEGVDGAVDQKRTCRGAHPLWREQQTRLPCRQATPVLQVERQQERRTEDRGTQHDQGDGCRAEGRPGEEPGIDQRCACRPQPVHHETDEHPHAYEDRRLRHRPRRHLDVADLGQAEDQHGKAGRQQRGTAEVERRARPRGRCRRHVTAREHHRGQPDREIDVEQPRPVGDAEDRSADERAEDRGQQGDHRDHTDDPARPPRSCRPREQGLPGRGQQPASEALQNPERHQAGHRPGERAEQRAGRKTRHRDDPGPAAAEPVRQPARRGNGGDDREQVGGADPLDLGDRGTELVGKCVDADGDDRRVQRRHERTEHQDERDAQQRRVDRLGPFGRHVSPTRGWIPAHRFAFTAGMSRSRRGRWRAAPTHAESARRAPGSLRW